MALNKGTRARVACRSSQCEALAQNRTSGAGRYWSSMAKKRMRQAPWPASGCRWADRWSRDGDSPGLLVDCRICHALYGAFCHRPDSETGSFLPVYSFECVRSFLILFLLALWFPHSLVPALSVCHLCVRVYVRAAIVITTPLLPYRTRTNKHPRPAAPL